MVSVKELKSVDLSSFTIVTTAIGVLFSIISSILIVIMMGVTTPSAIGASIYIISTVIVGTLMYTIYNSFCQGFLYNTLAKKINPIKLAFDGNKIIKVTTTETAIAIAMIETVMVILLYLASVVLMPLMINAAVQTLMYSGQQVLAYGLYQFMLLISQPATIAMIIFGTFIITFVFVLLGCYIYNILAGRGRCVEVELSQENNMTVINFNDVALKDEERQPCEVWTRVMGYHRPVSEFNRGKKSEYYSRKCFLEEKAVTHIDNESSLACAAE
jgi:hypothetical protein